MQIPALRCVETAILHEQFEPIDGSLIFETIKRLAAELKFAPEVQLMATSTQKDIHVHAGGHRILVSQNESPLEMDGFQSALSTPYTKIVFPDAPDSVRRHKANTFVTIGKGVLGGVPEEYFEKLGMQPEAFTTQDEAQRAIEFCHQLTRLIIQHHSASAIHWCLSDNLVPQSFFEAVSSSGDLTLLNIRPFLTSSAGQMGEGQPLGMMATGSQWLIGKMVEVEEAPVPFPWMMEMVLGFIKVCQVRGSIIPDNESFSVEGADWTVGVYHEKLEGHDTLEKVRLVVVNAPKFGIHGNVGAKRTISYDSVEDLRRHAEDEQRELSASKTTPTTQKSYNIGDLREFAKRSAADNAASQVGQAKSKSLFARAKGLIRKDH
ncbi:hypothetical protein [Roseibium sp. SCP14]|uniref:hypothetical protein n=1 Tax=Roseibium sp. SCP14 TaxID=3141375 RepID=UPI00333BB473